ncbi:MAG: XRE family transcriptional regulator [Nanoarchaeota archaeon]|nr:XRE family transcriptional regulator [Nanoarchaeota archaeon]
MKTHCEMVSQNTLPAIRALLAMELMEKYELTQGKTALKLGVSQAAVSQYTRARRGSKTNALLNDVEIKKAIKTLAGRMASGEIEHSTGSEEMCIICRLVREKKIIS